MNSIATPADLLPELSVLPTEDLLRRLEQGIANTAAELVRTAAIIRVLEERGVDLTEYRLGMIAFLRKVAYGQVVPGLVLRFAEYPGLLRRVAALPLPDQEKLSRGDRVTLAIMQDGVIQERSVDPLALTGDQVLQVFGRDRIRSVDEQASVLAEGPRVRRVSRRKFSVRIDRGRQKIIIGRMSVPISEVLAALSEAAGWSGVIDDDQHGLPTASAKLLPEEKERLKAMARATGLPEWELVRRAILAWLV